MNFMLHGSVEQVVLFTVLIILSKSSSVMVWKFDRVLHFLVGML